ncbi:uncharacterized protein si:dkeyp-72a4.1 [Xiphias gladius]|uniref:uncharacterized protein si:dkeyp-72a4.1 n=1 Tax=Xiphias gladius TaxID=8245 RepID=UPI001A99B575|nr:uncharacterized protein si:dkeyp-72a4.1 [Xiphias gladius]
MEELVKHLSRCQHLGWMDVIELKSASIHWLSCGRKAEPDIWSKMFCILSDSQLLMLDNLEVHPLLLAERAETCTVWLLRYTLHVTSAPPCPALKVTGDSPASVPPHCKYLELVLKGADIQLLELVSRAGGGWWKQKQNPGQ